MSAFVVEDKVINGVIAFLSCCHDLAAARRVIADETGADITTREGRQQLGDAMFKLNCDGVNARYGENEAEQFRALDYKYRTEVPPSAIQAYKSLACWSYQCAEGDIPETSLLYSTMGRVSDLLAHHIVSRLKEYDKADW